GRDDDMIVSGGENVFPQEVEDCLMRLTGVVEVAVVGVDDEEFGQRLRATSRPLRGRLSTPMPSNNTSRTTWRGTKCPATYALSRSSRGTPRARSRRSS